MTNREFGRINPLEKAAFGLAISIAGLGIGAMVYESTVNNSSYDQHIREAQCVEEHPDFGIQLCTENANNENVVMFALGKAGTILGIIGAGSTGLDMINRRNFDV